MSDLAIAFVHTSPAVSVWLRRLRHRRRWRPDVPACTPFHFAIRPGDNRPINGDRQTAAAEQPSSGAAIAAAAAPLTRLPYCLRRRRLQIMDQSRALIPERLGRQSGAPTGGASTHTNNEINKKKTRARLLKAGHFNVRAGDVLSHTRG